ncbi:MAG: ABC transporter permease, partial [Bacteroidota bacterium]
MKLFFADRRALLLTFLLPIALISLFALAFGGAGRSDEARPYLLPVSDLDSTSESQRVITQLDAEKSLTVVQFPLNEGTEAVKKGSEPALLILHKGFSDSIEKGAAAPIELLIDEAKEAEVGLLQQALYSKLFSITGSTGMKEKVLSKIEREYAHLDSATLNNIRRQVEENFGSSDLSAGDDGTPGMKVTKL